MEKEKIKTTPEKSPIEPAQKPVLLKQPALIQQPEGEVGGPEGLEPTRYGDWEQGGRCTDF